MCEDRKGRRRGKTTKQWNDETMKRRNEARPGERDDVAVEPLGPDLALHETYIRATVTDDRARTLHAI